MVCIMECSCTGFGCNLGLFWGVLDPELGPKSYLEYLMDFGVNFGVKMELELKRKWI